MIYHESSQIKRTTTIRRETVGLIKAQIKSQNRYTKSKYRNAKQRRYRMKPATRISIRYNTVKRKTDIVLLNETQRVRVESECVCDKDKKLTHDRFHVRNRHLCPKRRPEERNESKNRLEERERKNERGLCYTGYGFE